MVREYIERQKYVKINVGASIKDKKAKRGYANTSA
jgi:hypothetical protein